MMKKLTYVVFIILCFCLSTCQGNNKIDRDQWLLAPEEGSQKLLLGIDGADWRFIVPLIKQGKLPAMQKLLLRGAAGILLSQTMASPVEWTIIATGQTPEKNGITGFVVHDDKRGKKTVVSGNLRKVKAFWNILSETSKSVDVIGWWATWPAEVIKGVLVTDLFPFRKTISNACYPLTIQPFLEQISVSSKDELDRILERDFQLGLSQDSLSTDGETSLENDPTFGLFRRDFKYDLEKARYFQALFEKQNFDQTALFLNSTDIASHLFYRYAEAISENGSWPERVERRNQYGQMIEMAYRYAEKPLISILENTTDLKHICIVSDHGFTCVPYTMTAKWNRLLYELGLVVYRQDNSNKTFRNIDWQKTIAFYDPRKPHQDFCITINSDFQAAHQFEKSSIDADFLIKNKMAGVKYTDGSAMFTFIGYEDQRNILVFRIHKRDTEKIIFINGQSLPLDQLYFPPRLSGGHRKEGIILLWGAGVRQGYNIKPVTTLDVTPTLLWMNNTPVSKKMDGKVIIGAFNREAIDFRPVSRVDSYGLRQVEQIETSLADSIDDQIKSKLKALGYIN